MLAPPPPSRLPPTASMYLQYKDWWASKVKQLQAVGKTHWGLEPEEWHSSAPADYASADDLLLFAALLVLHV